MPKFGKIRVLVLGLIRDRGRAFLSEGYDAVKQQVFYRAMGGGINFGETSLDALKREFREEIQAELKNIRYLGCLENLFIYNGQQGHEIIQLYDCDFVEPTFYQLEQVHFNEGDRPKTARWIEIQRLRSGELLLVPETCLQYF